MCVHCHHPSTQSQFKCYVCNDSNLIFFQNSFLFSSKLNSMERYLSQSLTIVRNYSVRMSLDQEEIKTILDFWKFPNLKYVESLVYTAFQIHNIWFMRMEYIISNIDSEQNAVTVILVTTLCRWFYDGDRFKILVTVSLWWRLFSLCWWFFQCIKWSNLDRSSPS